MPKSNPVGVMTSINDAADQVTAAAAIGGAIVPISGVETAAVGTEANDSQFLQNANLEGVYPADLLGLTVGTIAFYPPANAGDIPSIFATYQTPESPHFVNGMTDYLANNADTVGATFTTAGLIVEQSGPGTITDFTSIVGEVTQSGDLSGRTDGASAITPPPDDSTEQAVTTVGNGAIAATGGALTPGLSVDAANPSDVTYAVFGLQSGEQGTVTFTDSSGEHDVVDVRSNGTYSANLSNLANGALTYLMTVTDAAGHVINVDPTAMLGDGSANAPAGSPELPNLLNGYVVRPPWDVAGVDYAVGVPTGTSLLNPATINLAGVSVNTSTHEIRISGNNVTLSGYDFSLNGGYAVYVTGANDTIENSNFGGNNPNEYWIYGAPSSSNLTIENNKMDESGILGATSIIGFAGSGSLTLEYNWLKNFPQHVLELAQSNGVNFSVVDKYNLIEQGGLGAGAHLNFLQFNGGNATSVDVEFNTSYETPQAAGGEGYQFYDNNSGGTINNTTFAYNTMIAANGGDGVMAMSYLLHGTYNSSSATFTGTVNNNYVNASAAYGTFYGNSFSGASVYNNYDMNTGSVVNADNSETAAVTNVTTSPSTGIEPPGTNITLTVDFSKTVTVSGIPTLTFDDGGTATYTGGSGTNALTFTYTVSSSDSAVSALAITGVNLPNGAAIHDGTANANLAGALVTFSGLAIDPIVTLTQLVHETNGVAFLSGAAEPLSTVMICADGSATPLGTVEASSSGTWSWSSASGFTNTAIHTFVVEAMDIGNVDVGVSPNIGTYGTPVNDVLIGGPSYVLSGGGGSDTFVFEGNFGNDLVNYFRASGSTHDILQFSATEFQNFAQVLSHAAQVASSVVITVDGADTVTLHNAKIKSLVSSDFHFV
jgi:hypothetical protein